MVDFNTGARVLTDKGDYATVVKTPDRFNGYGLSQPMCGTGESAVVIDSNYNQADNRYANLVRCVKQESLQPGSPAEQPADASLVAGNRVKVVGGIKATVVGGTCAKDHLGRRMEPINPDRSRDVICTPETFLNKE